MSTNDNAVELPVPDVQQVHASILEIDSDPVLASAKLIAEAWDAAGLYQVGSFGQDKWQEWNGHFRDDIRCFIKGDPNTVEKLRERLTGSFDLYREGDGPVWQSIHFVTCHDGFTLNDLVSFDHKHNQANRELNDDGSNSNLSWNCGVEGVDATPNVELLRVRQIKNFLALNLLSIGTPMLLMGDEVRQTQQGNNNAYCQDNEISWLDWRLCDVHKDIARFAQNLIRLRLKFNEGTRGEWMTLAEFISRARIEWHGVELGKPDWRSESHSVALAMHDPTVSRFGYMAVNAYWQPLEFELPPVAGGKNATWLRLIDTSLPSPEDIVEESVKRPVNGLKYLVNPRSIVMLHYRSTQGPDPQPVQ